MQTVAKPRHELWAECLREIGVLLLVFAPLEVVLRNERSLWWQWVVALMGVGQQADTIDFHVEAIDLLSNHVPCEAGIALVVAIYSAL